MTTSFFDISDNARVLVAEENIAAEHSLCKVLNDEGLITTAANAKNARDLLKQEVYELIILDRKLKGINVLSLARFFLFGARDVWFVVALPVFLEEALGLNFSEIGGFLGLWVVGYGIVQASAPGLRRFWRQTQSPGASAL